MSNSKAKVACIHICPNKIRILEGRISDGFVLVTKTALIEKASRFYIGDRLAYMSAMVDAIVNAMAVHSFTAKQVHIIYDNGLDVEFIIDERLEKKRAEKAARRNSLNNISLSFGKKDGKEKVNSKQNGVIVKKKAWGEYITEAEQGEVTTICKVERDLVDFLTEEFQDHGYKVLSIEPPETTMFYLRKFVPYTYDTINKLVVYADNEQDGYFYTFTKDSPSGQKAFHFNSAYSDDLIDNCVAAVQDEITKSQLRNPYVMLVGDAFTDEEQYLGICDALADAGIGICDLYGLWEDRSKPLNMLQVIMPDRGIDIEINGQFGVCVATLLRQLNQKTENLMDGFHPMALSKQTRKTLCSLALSASAMLAIYTTCIAGLAGYQLYVATTEAQRAASTTDFQLRKAENDKEIAQQKVEVLHTIDSRYNDIFRFAYQQVSDDLNIASIDTIDMLYLPGTHTPVTDAALAPTDPAATTPAETAPAEENPTTDVTQEATGTFKLQTIVIRGYSRTSEGPVGLYSALVSAGLGEVKIIGIEQVELETQETLFAFEMTVGVN